MAWRRTGKYRSAEEIFVLTCDVCERDVGFEDGRRPNEHFQVSRHPNPGALDEQQAPTIICSSECLRAYAARAIGPDRTTPSTRGGGSHRKPKRGA